MKSAIYTGNRTFSVGESVAQMPREGEVLIKSRYCGICGTDVHIYHGNMDGRVKIPQIIGHEVSGEVEACGPNVTGFVKGDKVVVRPLWPGEEVASDKGYRHIGKNLKFMGIDTPGGMQGYWTLPAFTLHKIPDHLSLKTAALIEPLAVACHDVRMSRLQKDETCVVLGGGPIGMMISMVAKAKGGRVLLSEINENRLTLARELGIEAVSPLKVDIVHYLEDFSEGKMADVVFEVSGSNSAVEVMTKLANIRGRIVMVAIHPNMKPISLFDFFWKELEMIGARVYEYEDYEEAIRLAAEGEIDLQPLITQTLSIDEVQSGFEAIDNDGAGMKYLIDCWH